LVSPAWLWFHRRGFGFTCVALVSPGAGAEVHEEEAAEHGGGGQGVGGEPLHHF
jgi:hypothetical protein